MGLDCPGCGMQRSLVALLRGHFSESLHLFPALLPFIFTLLLMVLHLRFRFKNGARYILYSYMATAGILVAGYLLKMVTAS